jgi:vacuolar-type H+-ATPase subunit F/Vma7
MVLQISRHFFETVFCQGLLMSFFRNSLDRLKSAGLCLLLCTLFLQTSLLVAADPKPADESPQADSDVKPLRAEKPEQAALEPPPRPRPETRAERRERLRYQVTNGLGSMTNLIGIPQIQRELNLSAAQQKEIADQTRRINLYVRSQSLDIADLPRGRQTAAMRKVRLQTRPVVEKRQKEMLKVLTDEQRMRLLGISLQMRGPKSLIDEEVIESLELTEEQVESILVILEEYDAKLQKLVTNSPTDSEAPLVVIQPASSRKSMKEKVEEQILAALTESQREKFKQLQGKPYEVQITGRLPTPIEPSENDDTKTLKELERDD